MPFFTYFFKQKLLVQRPLNPFPFEFENEQLNCLDCTLQQTVVRMLTINFYQSWFFRQKAKATITALLLPNLARFRTKKKSSKLPANGNNIPEKRMKSVREQKIVSVNSLKRANTGSFEDIGGFSYYGAMINFEIIHAWKMIENLRSIRNCNNLCFIDKQVHWLLQN